MNDRARVVEALCRGYCKKCGMKLNQTSGVWFSGMCVPCVGRDFGRYLDGLSTKVALPTSGKTCEEK